MIGALLLFTPVAAFSQSRAGSPAQLTCASDDGQRNYCSADTRGGVLMTRQLGNQACEQGSSWGYDRRGIWVDRGCRAEFTVRPYSYTGQEKTVAAGTQVPVRVDEGINASDNDGRIYTGVVAQNVMDQSGAVAIPAGSTAELIFRGTSNRELLLDLESVTVNGQRYALSVDPTQGTTAVQKEGLGANERTAKYVGGGALLGTIIGAIAGGGKGAAIGAAAGAGAGAGGQVLTRGRSVNIPPESVITFRLQEPLYLGIADNGYDRSGHHYHYPETIPEGR